MATTSALVDSRTGSLANGSGEPPKMADPAQRASTPLPTSNSPQLRSLQPSPVGGAAGLASDAFVLVTTDTRTAGPQPGAAGVDSFVLTTAEKRGDVRRSSRPDPAKSPLLPAFSPWSSCDTSPSTSPTPHATAHPAAARVPSCLAQDVFDVQYWTAMRNVWSDHGALQHHHTQLPHLVGAVAEQMRAIQAGDAILNDSVAACRVRRDHAMGYLLSRAPDRGAPSDEPQKSFLLNTRVDITRTEAHVQRQLDALVSARQHVAGLISLLVNTSAQTASRAGESLAHIAAIAEVTPHLGGVQQSQTMETLQAEQQTWSATLTTATDTLRALHTALAIDPDLLANQSKAAVVQNCADRLKAIESAVGTQRDVIQQSIPHVQALTRLVDITPEQSH